MSLCGTSSSKNASHSSIMPTGSGSGCSSGVQVKTPPPATGIKGARATLDGSSRLRSSLTAVAAGPAAPDAAPVDASAPPLAAIPRARLRARSSCGATSARGRVDGAAPKLAGASHVQLAPPPMVPARFMVMGTSEGQAPAQAAVGVAAAACCIAYVVAADSHVAAAAATAKPPDVGIMSGPSALAIFSPMMAVIAGPGCRLVGAGAGAIGWAAVGAAPYGSFAGVACGACSAGTGRVSGSDCGSSCSGAVWRICCSRLCTCCCRVCSSVLSSLADIGGHATGWGGAAGMAHVGCRIAPMGGASDAPKADGGMGATGQATSGAAVSAWGSPAPADGCSG
mmetsp:Transcript_11536/g.29770  ORF Transcript_11536/g.29770 Transcript_11536/m.29770 type:complete len:339 (-) Transcript_11536:76-1092(-)